MNLGETDDRNELERGTAHEVPLEIAILASRILADLLVY